MKKKYLFQLAQDLIMTAVLLSLFGYHLYEEITHEWLGLAFFALIISHLTLNTWWLKKAVYGQIQRLSSLSNHRKFCHFFAVFDRLYQRYSTL